MTRRIKAPPEVVWAVLDDFGDIQRWSPGVKHSRLTSTGPIGVGSTRHCDFAYGGATERIEAYEPYRRMTVRLTETFKLPMTSAVAEFTLAPVGAATDVTLRYQYTPTLLGRIIASVLGRQLAKGLNGILAGLSQECERIAAHQAGGGG